MHLILFSVDDEPHVRVVRDAANLPAGETLADLARMVEWRHSTVATVVEVLPDHDDTDAIREEYAEALGED